MHAYPSFNLYTGAKAAEDCQEKPFLEDAQCPSEFFMPERDRRIHNLNQVFLVISKVLRGFGVN